MLRLARPLGLLQPSRALLRPFCSAGADEKAEGVKERVDVTWAQQDSLPRLPVPDLQATAEEYRRMVRPLLSTKARHTTDQNIDWFKASAKVHNLQKELHALDEASPTSWLEGFWDTMYLEQRSPLPVNTSPYFALSQPPYPAFSSASSAQAERAASLTHLIASWAVDLWQRRLQPDVGLCMAQYQRLLGVARVPMPTRDQMWSTPSSGHVAVLCNGHFHLLHVLDDERVVDLPRLQHALEAIVQASRQLQEGEVGLLTAGGREQWAEARQRLLKDKRNERGLEQVQKALFVLCLDEEAGGDLQATSKQLLHGRTCANRWFDKLQVIVASNGTAGLVLEHAPVDGHTALRLASDVVAQEAKLQPWPKASSGPQPELLVWHVGDKVQEAVEEARATVAELVARTEAEVLHFEAFGKAQIKRAGMSPDAFVQMAFQLAYYRTFNRVVSTYESAMTKRFLHGRTETIRSVSDQSLAYVTHFSPDDPANSRQLLLNAVERHQQTARAAGDGLGVDRHLFVLHQLAQQQRRRLPGHEIPELFRDPAYTTFCSNVLSTSNCGSDALSLFGFGPVHDKGLGVGYIIKDADITVSTTSFNAPDARNFLDNLQQALIDQLQVAKQ